MEIIFRGQHLTISDEFRKHASDHLNKLTRYLPVADHAIVDVRREAKGEEGRFVVQVTVSANGTFLRAEERSFELSTAIDAASGVLVNDAMPQGTTFVSASPSPSNAPPAGAGGTVTWNLGNLANGASATLTLTVKVSIKGNTLIVNTASVTSSSSDPNPANNTATVTSKRIAK